MLERMDDFFAARIDQYDEHMLHDIEGAMEFYPATAAQLPLSDDTALLDLGCGTGLELESYFARRDRERPMARPHVTGIDLCAPMLEKLREKLPGEALSLIHGSYFDEPLGECCYDAALSVESFHHFTAQQKVVLYQKIHRALRQNGYLILTDYFAENEQQERAFRQQLAELTAQESGDGEVPYHYDTPLTVEHEMEALCAGGFSKVEILARWGQTVLMRAQK